MLNNKTNNIFLRIRNFIYKNIFRIKFGGFKINLSKYKLVIFDEFNNQDLNIWNKITNPQKIKFTNNGLELTNNTVIESNHIFDYGTYEFNVELPIGKNVESSIKLRTDDNCIITVMDAKSDSHGNYKSNIFNSIRYGIDGLNTKETKPARTLIYGEEELKTFFINIKCFISRNKITIYYNNYRVGIITDEKILKYFKEKKFIIKLEVKNLGNDDAHLLIKNFSYYNRMKTQRKSCELVNIIKKL